MVKQIKMPIFIGLQLYYKVILLHYFKYLFIHFKSYLMNKILMLCLACFCMWTNYATAQCTAVAPPYTEDFTSFIPTCWTEAQGRPNVSTVLTGTTSTWQADGFGNVGTTGAARMNIYSTNRNEWLISPSIDLGTGTTTYQLEFDVILTDFIGTGADLMDADDTLAVFISTDNGATWSTNDILRLWDVNDQPSNTGDAIAINLAGYTGVVKFGFYGASSLAVTDYNVYIDNFMVRIPPSCPAPTALTTTNISTNSVDFGFTERATATQWEVEYGVDGFTPGTGTAIVTGSNPLTVNSLTSDTDYDFYVRAICGPGDSSIITGPSSFTTLISCPAPSALMTSNVTTTALDFAWTENGTATSWQVEYDVDGFTQGTGNMMVVSANPTAITGLAAATDYDFYVRAVCGAGDSSTWVGPFSATTLCDVITPAYSENFDTYVPTCWTEQSGKINTPLTGTSSGWFAGTFGNISGTTAAEYNLYTSTAGQWVISPSIDLGTGNNYQVEFDVAATDYNDPGVAALFEATDTLAVVISTDNGVTWSTANILQIWEQGSEPSATGDNIVIDLSPYSGVVKIGFYAIASTSSASDFDVSVDNFKVRVPPTCNAPSALISTNLATNSADFGFTENGTATQWAVEYGPTGFAQGSGITVGINSNPATITGLTAATDYDFYVRAICGPGDSSTWVGPSSFATLCGPIMAPWTETFTATSLPNCWIDSGQDPFTFSTTPDWGATGTTDYTTGGGTNYAWIDGSTPNTAPDTLMTPFIDATALTTPHLCFALFSNNTDNASNNTIGIEFYDGATWNILATFQQNLGPDWAELSYDLSAFTISGPVQARFIVDMTAGNNAFYNDILLDDISLNNGGCAESCITPGQLTATNITATTADLGSASMGSSFELEYGIDGFTQGTGNIMVSSNNPATVSGLTQNTDYQFYVRNICGAGDTSIVAGPFDFTTLANCPAPSALMTSNATTTTLDFGWTENGTATSWQVEYDVDGFTQGAGNMMVVATNPTAITGLTADTDYDFYVRAICGAGDSSTWVGPFSSRTPCAVIIPTYTTNFATFLPACWSDSDDGTVTTGPIGTNISDWDQDGTSAIFNLYSDDNSDWLISPEFDLSTGAWQLEIDANAADFTFSGPASSFSGMGSDDSVQVVISTDNGATWTAIYTWDVNNSLTFAPATTTVSLTAYTSNAIFGIIASEGFVDDTEDYYAIINNFAITPFVAPPAPNLVITEIMYNSPESGADSLEFIEIYNAEPITVDVSGYSLTGVTHTFGAGTSIAAGGYYVVAVNATAFNTVYGMSADAIWASGGLSNGGETILLLDANGATVDSVRYATGGVWPSSPNGNGPSLVFCDVTLDNADGANWFASTTSTGVTINGNVVMASPGAADMICTPTAPFEDVAASAYIGLDSVYCGANVNLSGQLVITNNTAVDAANVPYTITVDGFPVLTNTITLLAGNSSDTITVGPLPVTPGSYDIAAFTSYMADSLITNDTISTTIVVSNTTASIASSTNTSCNGTADGMATAMGSNGVPGYNYMWSDGTMGATLMNAAAGTYTVVVTDTVGCVDSTTTVISEPAVLSTINTATNVDCNANATGGVDLTVSGGTPNYTFVWSDGSTMEDASGLMAGAYYVTVTDANGCMAVDSATVTQPAALVVSTNQDSSGNATSIVTGGTTPYAYLWDDNNAQNTATATGLQNGTYTVVVTDANNCQDSATINVVVIGVESLASVASLNMFPNPTTANVFVQLDLVQTADVTVQVMTVTGQSVLTKVVGAMQSELIELPTANLATGVYLVQMNIGDEQVTRKLIITRN